MSDPRRKQGEETWFRLLEWTKDQAASERLAALILHTESFRSIDPSHPLGGKDGLKDMVCEHNGKRWVAAAYFPRGQQTFKDIENKFQDDVAGSHKNNAQGFIFITNQELRIKERETLKLYDASVEVEIYHLERLSSILNTPGCYGIRLEFLDIEMEKTEQIAFFANFRSWFLERFDQQREQLREQLDRIEASLVQNGLVGGAPMDALLQSQSLLDSIAHPSLSMFGSSGLLPYGLTTELPLALQNLKELEETFLRLTSLFGFTGQLPYAMSGDLALALQNLKEFEETLQRASNLLLAISPFGGLPNSVQNNLDALLQYEGALDRILAKQNLIQLPSVSEGGEM